MAKPAELETLTGLASRFGAFVADRHPFALADALEAFEKATGGRDLRDEAAIEAVRPALRRELHTRLHARPLAQGLPDTTPRTTVASRMDQAYRELLDACDGFLRRAAIEASLTREERLEILRGMVLTRATDNRLKTFFLGGEVRFGATALQGKGFRSLGQEAIYGAAMRLRRGPTYRVDSSTRSASLSPRGASGQAGERSVWTGDVIGPMIRDLGVTLAMRPDPATVRMVLNSQMAKAGPPTDGKDFGYGDLD